MRRFLTRLVLLLALLAPPPAAAKPKGCLSTGELKTEQLVRHGVFLREASAACDSLKPGTRKMWADFDQSFSTQLSTQTKRRMTIFSREFPKTSKQMMTYFDGRMVTNYRYNQPSAPLCADVEKLLKKVQKGGWGQFALQAKTIQDNVRLDFKWCGQ
jgi:hypothetical protein